MTDTRVQHQPWAWQAQILSAVRHNPRVLLLGPPGSGKSTVAWWAFDATADCEAALLVTMSRRKGEKQGQQSHLALTNRLLRDPAWPNTGTVVHATASPDLLTSPPSVRRLISRSWDLVVCDGVDEWAEDAQRAASLLIAETRPPHVLVTSRWHSAARTVVPEALVVEAPPPRRVGRVEGVKYEESRSEAIVRARIEALLRFAGPVADRYGLRRVDEAWASSPFAAQQAALSQLAVLRPERNVAAHAVRPGEDDEMLLFVVQGLELIVDAIDRLEDDSHRNRLTQLLLDRHRQNGERWVVTSEPATMEYLSSTLTGWGSSDDAGIDLFSAGVRLFSDDGLDAVAFRSHDELIHYDLPSTSVVTERVRALRVGPNEPVTQWGIFRVGDGRARRILRALERS